MQATLLALTTLGYLVGCGLLLQAALGERPLAAARWAVACGGVALAAHAALLFLPAATGAALSTHFFQALSLVAWAMALVMTLVHAGGKARLLLAVIWPIALGSAVAGALATSRSEAIGGWQIRLHVAIALSAYALLSIAALQALAVAWQERSLRRKHLGALLRALPPLSAMEELLFHYIVAGFALLTLTVLSGALFIDDWMAQHLVHKTVLTLLAWVVFGLLVFGRWRFGWRGRTAVRWTLAGMAVLLLAFFGSKFVLEILLQR